MKKISICIFVCALIFTSYAQASWVDRSGKPIADAPDRKSIGNLGVTLLLTDKEQETLARWNTQSEGVHINGANTIERGKTLTALIIFSGCAKDKNSHCNLVVKFQIVQPDGKVSAALPYQEVWVGKPAPPDKALGMGVSYLRIIVEHADPLGAYKVYAKVIDKNTKHEIRLTSVFNVTDKAPSGK